MVPGIRPSVFPKIIIIRIITQSFSTEEEVVLVVRSKSAL